MVSLPRAFVFRLNVDDPHPIPWIRVKLSAAIGDALYPHPQWQRLGAMWESFYPPVGLAPETQALLRALQASMPAFVALLVNHRPQALRGRSLTEVMEPRRASPRGSPRSIGTGTRSRRKCIARRRRWSLP